MSNPIGNISGGSITDLPSLNPGATVFDVTKYGAVDGSLTAGSMLSDAWAGMSAAVFALINSGKTAEMYLPTGKWVTNIPMFLPFKNFTIRGESMAGTTIQTNSGLSPLIVAQPENGYIAMTSGHWPAMNSAFLGMDSTWSGNRFAFRLYDPATGLINGTSQPDFRAICVQASTFTQGPAKGFWTDTPAFTMEFGLNCQIANPASPTPLGVGFPPPGFGFQMMNLSTTNIPRPWQFEVSGGVATATVVSAGVITVVYSLNTFRANGGPAVGSLVAITSSGVGGNTGKIGQVTAVSAGQYTLSASLSTIATGDTISISDGVAFAVNVATLPRDDGQVAGLYDPTEDGTQYVVGFKWPTSVTFPTSTNSWRFILQLDLTASTRANAAQAWFSTTGSALANYVPMAQGNVSLPALPMANPQFVEASFGCFVIGGLQTTSSIVPIATDMGPGGYLNAFNAKPTILAHWKMWQLAICGLSMTKGLNYTPATGSTTPTLNASGPSSAFSGTMTDLFHFGNAGSGQGAPFAYLTLQDSGLTVGNVDKQGGKLAGVSQPTASFGAVGMVWPMIGVASNTSIGSNVVISDLTISAPANCSTGSAISSGPILSGIVRNVTTTAFQHGWGYIPCADSYSYDFENLTFNTCADAAIFAFQNFIRATNIGTVGCRMMLRAQQLVLIGDCLFSGIPVASPYSVIKIHGADGGITLDLKNFNNDNETPSQGPTIALIDVGANQSNAHYNVNITSSDFGSGAIHVPMVKLRSSAVNSTQGYGSCRISQCAWDGNSLSTMVQVTGDPAGWHGSIVDTLHPTPNPNFDGVSLLQATKSPNTSRIALVFTATNLPCTGAWTAGRTTIEIPAEAWLAGKPKRFTCATSGYYGGVPASGLYSAPVWESGEVYSPDGAGDAFWCFAPREEWATCTLSG